MKNGPLIYFIMHLFLFCPIISLQQETRAGVGKVGCSRGLWQIGCSKTLTGQGLLSPSPKGGDEGKEPNNKLLSGSACEMQEQLCFSGPQEEVKGEEEAGEIGSLLNYGTDAL